MATNAQVLAAINSLVNAVQSRPASGGGVVADYIEVSGVTPLWKAVMVEVPPTESSGSTWVHSSSDVVGLTGKLPQIVNPRDIIVLNGVMTVRITRKVRASHVSADTVIPIAVTCVPAGDGVTLRVALPQIASNVPANGSFVSATLVSWTPVATARYSM